MGFGFDFLELARAVKAAGGKVDLLEGPATFTPEKTLEGLVRQGEKVGIWADPVRDPDVHSLISTPIYGIKGIAAYADYALAKKTTQFINSSERA
jgi:hydroxylamine reductase